ncbi:MAG: nucleotidyltransferase domain-containing protein [Ardenticatenaceae bacterium]|nr:nucleotidyltransferase domain-containing protein [Ardenticatenaceae bacterium]MCB9443167.1 nucleotidyltransferase domain-containing protein [Ardenticatenaceae bacterium]
MSEQYSAYMPHIRQRWADEQAGWEKRRQQAWAVAGQIAGMLRAAYGADQIIAFGSLVGKGPFDEQSDIDLAVSGVSPAHFFRAYAQAMAITSTFKLDLIDLDDCPIQMRQTISQSGVHL